jgi:CHAD domain-containing protein
MAKPTRVKGVGPGRDGKKAARRMLAARLADVRLFELAARGGDVDGVHDLRVASRRLRAALTHLSADRTLSKLERKVNALQDALGDVRDLHLLRRWPSHAHGNAAALWRRSARLEREEARAVRVLEKVLARWCERDAPKLAAHIGQAKLHALGRGRARRGVARGVARLTAAADVPLEDAERLHRVRILAKKLKYQAELLTPVLTGEMKALVAALDPVQSSLGALHDLDERMRRLEVQGRDRDAQRRYRAERTRLVRAAARALKPWRDGSPQRALTEGPALG